MSLSPAQLQARKGKIGASDLAAACGLDSYTSRLKLWFELTGRAPAYEDTPDQEWGRLIEPLLRRQLLTAINRGRPNITAWERIRAVTLPRWYGDRVLALSEDNDQATVQHPDLPWLVATPDDVYLDPAAEQVVAGGEVKNRSIFTSGLWGEAGTDLIPDGVLIQAMAGMACLGLAAWRVGAYFGGSDFRTYVAQYDREIFESLASRAEEFLDRYVKTDTPPPVEDGSEGTHQTLALLFPRHSEVIAPATEDEVTVVAAYIQDREDRLLAEKREGLSSAMLKAIIADRAGLSIPRGDRVTWKKTADSIGVDWEAVARHLADQMETPEHALQAAVRAHPKTTPGSRRMYVAAPKKERQ